MFKVSYCARTFRHNHNSPELEIGTKYCQQGGHDFLTSTKTRVSLMQVYVAESWKCLAVMPYWKKKSRGRRL